MLILNVIEYLCFYGKVLRPQFRVTEGDDGHRGSGPGHVKEARAEASCPPKPWRRWKGDDPALDGETRSEQKSNMDARLPPRYALRLEDLRAWHVIRVSCRTCRHRC